MSDPAAARRLFHNAKREALIVTAVWGLAFAWVVTYCYLRGYEHKPTCWAVKIGLTVEQPPERLTQVAGFPTWVWYGIVLPWIACTIFTVLFGFFGIADDDLGRDADDHPEGGHGH